MDDQRWGTSSYRATPPGRVHALKEYLAAGEGMGGKLDILKVLTANRLGRKDGGSANPIPVRLRGLGGAALWIRPGSTDLINASAYLARRIHEPPPGVGPLRRVVELGTNMGAGLAALAAEHPDAELVGVEADAGNVAAARANLDRFGPRARVIEAAVWSDDAGLVVDPERPAGEHGLTVRERVAGDDPALPGLQGRAIDTLLDEAFPGEVIDYMHVTIEGTERRVFEAGGAWPTRVRSLRVEVHPYFDYLTGECIAQLERLGYRAYPVQSPPDKWVFAVRDELT